MTDYGHTVIDTKTYTVQLDKACNILLGDSFEDTFKSNEDSTSSGGSVTPIIPVEDDSKSEPEYTFADVAASAYYHNAVLWAAENGITSGTDATHFSPDASCTRAQIVTFLWRAAGSPEPKAAAGFTDVAGSSYYAKAVAWAVENGITSGTSATTFSPDATCTRAQIVTFLHHTYKK